MAISFIITTYNILPYIERCLQSVIQVARPGDEVILIDDGSDDGTAEHVQTLAAERPFAKDVIFRPIYLGTNTIGGVGIGANIGLSEARCDTVFFVDGDDWIDVSGFERARSYWGIHPSDILFTNYLEFDQTRQETKLPADARRWASLNVNTSLEGLRAQALAFIAVPWRKFYRRDFLEAHRLRFPEGDFFFEDNPFHWAVCMRAGSIGFLDTNICYHRVNRPGQTMASTGAELAAFFTHFRTILNGLPESDRPHRLAAMQWLLSNMTWHMPRLSQHAHYAYAYAASQALKLIPDEIWTGELAAQESDKAIWPVADRLRSGDINGQVDNWQRQSLDRKLSRINTRLEEIEAQNQALARALQGLGAAETFEAIVARRKALNPRE